jgi:hypothetical protein
MQISPSLATFFLCTALAAAAQTGASASPTLGQVRAQSRSQMAQPAQHLLDSAIMAPAASAAPAPRFPGLQAVITGLEAAQRANHAHMIPFAVTREYELFSGDNKEPKGGVIAEIHFQPPTTKTWEITKTTGSERAEKVVRSILEREVKYASDGKIAIGHEHYDFRYFGNGETDHRPCYILQLIPKHDEGNLMRGRIWVDRDTYLIHRFEGEPAKNPSWWIKDLKLSTTYGDIGGIWLPTSSKGVADVRLFGPHTMTEHTLSYRAEHAVVEGPAADLTRLARSSRSYRPSTAAAGIIIGR